MMVEVTSDLPEIPDRVSVEPGSPFHWPEGLRHETHRIMVMLNGARRDADVVEFCRSGGWIRMHVPNGKGGYKSERGRLVAIMRHGRVDTGWESRDGN